MQLATRRREYGGTDHCVHNREESRDRLRLLANLGLVDLELDTVMLKILFHLLAINIVDVDIRHGEASLPALVAICEIGVGDVEHAIDKGEVVLDLLVSFDVKTSVARRCLCLFDSGFEV